MSSIPATVQDYLIDCRIRRISDKTLHWYEQKLSALVPYLPADTADLTTSRIRQVIDEQVLHHGRSAHTERGYVQVLISYLRFLADEELIPERVIRRLERPKAPQRLIRTLSEEQVGALYAACHCERSPWLRLRDRALLSFLLDTGCRAGEVCHLRACDLVVDTRDPHAVVIGKGDKQREVGPLSGEGIRDLRRYLRVQPRRGEEPFFLSRYHQPMTPGGLDQMLYRLRDWAGLREEPDLEIRAHVFRHTYAVRRLEEGMEIKRLSLLLGHTSVTTTERYLADFQQRHARLGAGAKLRK